MWRLSGSLSSDSESVFPGNSEINGSFGWALSLAFGREIPCSPFAVVSKRLFEFFRGFWTPAPSLTGATDPLRGFFLASSSGTASLRAFLPVFGLRSFGGSGGLFPLEVAPADLPAGGGLFGTADSPSAFAFFAF